MINYTERIWTLMDDVVARVPALSFVDMQRVLVFARAGRTGAEGAYATCHCLSLAPSEPGYYFWRDRATGALTRRSEWFITKSPIVTIDDRRIEYMISFTLPRFCDQRMAGSRKQAHYAGQPDWVGKLDTIIHELYHIAPDRAGIRRVEKADGTYAANCHGGVFLETVVQLVHEYLGTGPDPAVHDFLQYDLDELSARCGGVAGTAFRGFPSYPQRYTERVDPPPMMNGLPDRCPVEPLKPTRVRTRFTEEDLVVRAFRGAVRAECAA